MEARQVQLLDEKECKSAVSFFGFLSKKYRDQCVKNFDGTPDSKAECKQINKMMAIVSEEASACIGEPMYNNGGVNSGVSRNHRR